MNTANCLGNLQESAWDLQGLLDTVGSDSVLIDSLIKLFVEDSQKRMKNMKTALSGANFKELRGEAHTIKGAAGNIRANKIQQWAFQLETSAAKASLIECKRDLQELENHLILFYQGWSKALEHRMSSG